MEYTEEFEQLWKTLPKRCGGNPKPLAFKQFKARLKQGVEYSDLIAGAARYANFCDKTGKTGTEWVLRAATFLGVNNESWTETWELPKQEIKEDKKDFPPNFDSGSQCGAGESFEACKIRAWREYVRT